MNFAVVVMLNFPPPQTSIVEFSISVAVAVTVAVAAAVVVIVIVVLFLFTLPYRRWWC